MSELPKFIGYDEVSNLPQGTSTDEVLASIAHRYARGELSLAQMAAAIQQQIDATRFRNPEAYMALLDGLIRRMVPQTVETKLSRDEFYLQNPPLITNGRLFGGYLQEQWEWSRTHGQIAPLPPHLVDFPAYQANSQATQATQAAPEGRESR